MKPKANAACWFLVLVSTMWLPGEAQLCEVGSSCEFYVNATQSFQQYELSDGVKTCFSCLFNGTIENDTTWFIDDSPDIPLTTGPNPFGTNNNGVLEICNTTNILDSVADATPRFVCQSLTANASHSLFITLRALNPPSITPLAEPIVVDEGLASLELRCLHADSEPITSEEWRGPDGTVVSTQASLILTNLFRDDTGEYTCTITNDMGETRSTSRTIIVRCNCFLPPTNVVLSATAPNVLTLTWDPPSPLLTTATVESWILEVEELDGDDFRNESSNDTMFVPTNSTETMFEFTGLTMLTTYCVRVAGVFVVGQEIVDFSESICSTTLPDPTSTPAPINLAVTVTGLSAFALNIAWQPPEELDTVAAYLVSIKEASANQYMELDMFGPDTRSLLLWGRNSEFTLMDTTTYDVQVVAMLSVSADVSGIGQGTTLSIATPQPIYVSPEASDITQTSAVISWIHPGGTVNAFTVQYTTADGDSFTVTVDDGDNRFFQLSGLRPATMYSVAIASTNDNGTSAFSPAASFTTPDPVQTSTLPTGAIVGIAIGGVAGLILVVIVLVVVTVAVLKLNGKKQTSPGKLREQEGEAIIADPASGHEGGAEKTAPGEIESIEMEGK